MHYTLNQLQIFLTVSQTDSVTKAAEALHLTQPAVSIQLANFQKQFEIPLTEIIGRKLYITDFGKEIAVAAQKILDEVNAINNKTLAFRGHLSGRLKLSIVSTGEYIMPYFLSGFLKQHEGVELVMDVTNKAKVVESLENNEVDFALATILPANLKIERLALMENNMFLVSSPNHPYKNKIYGKQLFKELPLIYREPGSGTRKTMEKYFEQHYLPVLKKLELTSNEAVKQAVIAGLGYSIMPYIGMKNELKNGELEIIPVKGFPLKSTWNLIWLKGKNFSPVAGLFLNYIKQEKSGIVNKLVLPGNHT